MHACVHACTSRQVFRSSIQPCLQDNAISTKRRPVRGKELAAHRGLEKEEEHVPLVVPSRLSAIIAIMCL